DPDDLLATLTEMTAVSVADALAERKVAEVVATGGGTRNPVLMAALAGHLPGVEFLPLERFGVGEAAKEALLFAVIGYLSVVGLPGSVPSCTGARRASVLGSVTPGDRPLARPVGLVAPVRLQLSPVFAAPSGATGAP
ncbi:MAG: anmK, partial [Acidimicrobiaceae bacterium]|nr:anmK [Acidimicrobiaceae bacterium]